MTISYIQNQQLGSPVQPTLCARTTIPSPEASSTDVTKGDKMPCVIAYLHRVIGLNNPNDNRHGDKSLDGMSWLPNRTAVANEKSFRRPDQIFAGI